MPIGNFDMEENQNGFANMTADLFPSDSNRKHQSQFQISRFSLGRSAIQKPFDFFKEHFSILSNNKIILFDVLTE